AVIVFFRIVEAGENSGNRIIRLLVLDEFEVSADFGRGLIVEADERLVSEQVDRGIGHFEVVRLSSRHIRNVRRRIPLQDVQAGLIQATRWNSSKHAAVAKHPVWLVALQAPGSNGSLMKGNRLPRLSVDCEKSPCRSSSVG